MKKEREKRKTMQELQQLRAGKRKTKGKTHMVRGEKAGGRRREVIGGRGGHCGAEALARSRWSSRRRLL